MLSLPVELRGMTAGEEESSLWWTLPSGIHGFGLRLYYEAAGL